MYDPNQFIQSLPATQSMAPLGTAMNVPTGMGGFSAPGMRPQMGMNRPDMGPGNNPFSPGYRPQMGMDRDRSDMGPGPRPPGTFGQQLPGTFGQQLPGTFGQAMPQGGQQMQGQQFISGLLGNTGAWPGNGQMQPQQPPGLLWAQLSQQLPGMLSQQQGTLGQSGYSPNSLLWQHGFDPRASSAGQSGMFGQAMPQGGQASLGGAVPGGQYNQAIPQQGALGGGFGFSNPFAPQPAQMPQMQPLPAQMPPAQPGQTGAMGQGLGSLY